jgi:crotonobetainyl-CoA:carnitine CoA-transferase CaiB-like acyl-CoA transferase
MTGADDTDAPRTVTDPTQGLALLRGIRVIDFSQALSGPYCTMMLGDLGADVIKIESPSRGDDARHWGPPFVGEDAAYFISVNRNKRSVALDLKDPNDLDTARRLVADADVVVQNWRPGTAARLGLGPAELTAGNPLLVYCSISGFGQDAPPRAGYDQIVQGTSGLMSLTGAVGQPTKWGVPAGDIAAGMFATTAILAALFERTSSGRGRVVDIAMQDCLVSMLTHQAARYLATGVLPPKDHNGHSAIAPYGLFETADGFVNICVGNDAQFARLCAAMDLTDVLGGERFRTNPQRLAHQSQLLDVLGSALRDIPTADVIGRLEAAGVPVGAVRDLAEVFADPAVRDRGMVLPIDFAGAGRVEVANTPWQFDGRPSGITRNPPRLGEHTADVIAEIRATVHDRPQRGLA